MKKIISYLLSFVSYLSIAPFAFAQTPTDTTVNVCPPGSQFSVLCNFTSSNFGQVIGGAINVVFVIAVIAAVLYLIYGGIKWIMSGGDKTAVEGARAHIVAAVVGLIVVFLAYFIISIVLGVFLGTGVGLGNLKLPTLGGIK